MTPAEVERFLAGHAVAVVCGHDENGTLTARRCHLQQDGDGVELTLRPPRRCFDLTRYQTVCVSVDTYPSPAQIKGVIMTGPARWRGTSAVMDVEIKGIVSFDFSRAG
jgi:hypothetical protein